MTADPARLDQLSRDELPDLEQRLARTLDAWVELRFGIRLDSGHPHGVGVFLTFLDGGGLRIVPVAQADQPWEDDTR